MSSPQTSPPEAPPIVDKRTTPAGVLPRHIQAWSLLGLAGLMTLVMLFSGPTQPAGPKAIANPALQTTDPSRARIEQYARQVDEQAQRLAAERAEVELAKRALRGLTTGTQSNDSGGNVSSGASQAAAGQEDALSHERVQRDYRSLFVDSVVWTARPVGPTPAARAAPAPSAAGAGISVGMIAGDAKTATAEGAAQAGAGPDTPGRSQNGGAPRHVLREGTLLDAVLLNRLDGQFVGPVNAMVTTPAYSADRQHVLIPRGSRLLGEARAVDHRGQSRLAVLFHRLLLPNGDAIELDQVRGLNQVGDSGLRDEVDHHYWQIFGSALAIGALGGLAQGYEYGGDTSAADVYARGTASTFGQSATHVLDRFLNVLPTVVIREGHRLRVYLSRDLSLPSAERLAPVTSQEVP